LALRIILDENQAGVPVSQVARVEAGRVVAVDLSSRKLVRLPAQVGALTALRSLVLSDNLLDTVPSELWSLPSLSQLDLGGNRLRALDPRVSGLKNLLFLGLRDNALEDLPPGVLGLDQLETLLLAGNSLDSLPGALAGLAFLRYLDASSNGLVSVPFALAAMETLDTVDLSLNRLERLPDALRGLPAATRVRLAGNQLCALSAEMQAWASAKDPAWRETQQCGSPVRRAAPRTSGPRLATRPLPGGNELLLLLPAGSSFTGVDLLDARGTVLRRKGLLAVTGAWISLGTVPSGTPAWARLSGPAGALPALTIR
jgi:Leucine-rich repeat (LRR) protein